jgi:hypothetical protein
MAETVTDKEGIIAVEGKLEISGAVSETIFRADAETTLQLDASDAANALLIMGGANTDTISSLMKAAPIQDTWLILILTMPKSLAR